MRLRWSEKASWHHRRAEQSSADPWAGEWWPARVRCCHGGTTVCSPAHPAAALEERLESKTTSAESSDRVGPPITEDSQPCRPIGRNKAAGALRNSIQNRLGRAQGAARRSTHIPPAAQRRRSKEEKGAAGRCCQNVAAQQDSSLSCLSHPCHDMLNPDAPDRRGLLDAPATYLRYSKQGFGEVHRRGQAYACLRRHSCRPGRPGCPGCPVHGQTCVLPLPGNGLRLGITWCSVYSPARIRRAQYASARSEEGIKLDRITRHV